jgi:hypothetical protein
MKTLSQRPNPFPGCLPSHFARAIVFSKPFAIVFLLLIAATASAQNLEELGVKKGVKLNGSFNVNTVGYWAHSIEQRRDPFNWFLTGNLNVNLFGYNAPFSFSYSNADKNFSQPFNQFSFAPQYKWVRTYLGYNAMTFSPYTLSGHVFFGGGAELTPGKWRIAMMYGRLKKAVPFNPADTLQYSNAAFKRMGYGLKVGYENNGDAISANIFTAKDELNSIPFILPEAQLAPQQNVAMSISGRKTLFARVFVEAEYALSALNTDLRVNNEEGDTIDVSTDNLVKGLLPENATSRYFDALNASVGYQGNWYAIRLKYERISPEYQTLGAYYFNNDMENFTIAPTVKLLNGKLNLSANAGLQKNNLDDTRASSTERWVGTLNANYVPGSKWNFAANYSNFTSYTNIRPREDPFFNNTLDTLNFYQVSHTMSGTVMRMLGGKNNPQTLMLNTSYQQASDQSTFDGGTTLSDFRSANLSYSYSFVPSNTTLALAANIYENNAAGFKSTFWGPTLSMTKAFFKKTLKGSLASSYNETSATNAMSSPVWSNRVALSYSPNGTPDKPSAHNFALGLNVLRRFKGTEQQPAFTEFTSTFNYTYTF